ncbi:predicted protein [Uncinocarpus reesii 1704]|uniref:Aminoglycoside phosphotransferase domain-containing protein n=1 Tax=Uncinocarpus reesii (strain UAMH 1704) TaxID=336963 RepID=C4JF42_UNCRE|nr:uncharacterized protein UREG_00944 [Uncinocarpus reesii 1704]EEP76095.1 predicted protein [Uncinocarpus reesii 1704]
MISTNTPAIGGCIKVLKCVEGQYNKALIMTLDNGLGAEYILEEKARGVPLGNLWYDWAMESRRDLIDQLVDFESKVKSIWFRKHGCLYFKKDIAMKRVPFREPEPLRETFSEATEDINAVLLDDFVIGPVTEAVLWEGEKQSMELDRGPWNSPESYFAALTINEMRWMQLHAKPRVNLYRSLDTPEYPDDYISLLKKFLQLVSLMSPDPSQTSLSHPDLHLDNIFVDPGTKKITCVIGWQAASISEPFLQQHIPRMLLPIGGSNSRSPVTPEDSNGTTDLLNYYQNLSRRKNNRWWAATGVSNHSVLIDTLRCMLGTWNKRDLFSFRHALIGIIARWQHIQQTSTPCPIDFTPSELQLHSDEMELLEGLSQVLHGLQNNNLISLGGMVLREDFEQTSAINQRVKKMFIDLVESQEQKELCSRIWPYQDREH